MWMTRFAEPGGVQRPTGEKGPQVPTPLPMPLCPKRKFHLDLVDKHGLASEEEEARAGPKTIPDTKPTCHEASWD